MMAHDPSLFAGGAALNALDESETTHFGQHLDECATCQDELHGFLETAARLGSASAEAPPASMRAAVLAAIAVTRQVPPQPAHLAEDEEPTPGTRPQGLPVSIAKPDTPSAVNSTRPVSRDTGLADVIDLSSRRRFNRMLLTAAVAVAVALAAFSAVFMLNRSGSNDAAGMRQCIDTATDRRQEPAAAGSAGVSQVVVSASCGAALVKLSAIPAPAPGSTYQMWVIAGDEVRSVGIMDPDANGNMPDTVAPVKVGDTAIGVTVEPAGGSKKPSGAPVITISLAG